MLIFVSKFPTLKRPDRFLLSDLVDWMFEVMHKNPLDWGYKRTDLRLDILPLINCAVLQNLPIGLKTYRCPTLDYLERVRELQVQHSIIDPRSKIQRLFKTAPYPVVIS